MRPTVLVVDDSTFMRAAITRMIERSGQMRVVGTARDGDEAIQQVKTLKPDMMTLDIEMPRMDGISALKVIMREHPLPVLVLSSISVEGAEAAMEALDLGAVDFLCKDLQDRSLTIVNIEEELVGKLSVMVKVRKPLRASAPGGAARLLRSSISMGRRSLTGGSIVMVVIGTSAGGPKALQEVIPYLPRELKAGIVVVQHMPPAFTKVFASRLNEMSPLDVKEAETGDRLRPGMVIVAKGGYDLRFHRRGSETIVQVCDPCPDRIYHPCVDIAMESAVKIYGCRVLGIVMTGMGDDGTKGLRAVRDSGGKTFVQDEASSAIFGMPKSALNDGPVDKIISLSQMSNEIVNMV